MLPLHRRVLMLDHWSEHQHTKEQNTLILLSLAPRSLNLLMAMCLRKMWSTPTSRVCEHIFLFFFFFANFVIACSQISTKLRSFIPRLFPVKVQISFLVNFFLLISSADLVLLFGA